MRGYVVALLLVCWCLLDIRNVNAINEDVYYKLCNITKTVTGLLKYKVENDALREAIYGSSDGALFGEDGGLKGGKCGYGKMRSQLCIVSNRHTLGIGKDGCYAESLFGSFYCLCTPGSNKENVGTLCGRNVQVYRNKGWWHEWHSSMNVEDLFDDVWKNVIKQCSGVSQNNQDMKDKLENLKRALMNLNESFGKSENGLFYYGGNRGTFCNGITQGDACLGYPRASKDNVSIPWMKKIEDAIEKLENTEQYSLKAADQSPTAGSAPSAYIDSGEDVSEGKYKKPTSQLPSAAENISDQKGNGESQPQSIGNNGDSSASRPRNKRSTEGSTIINVASLSSEGSDDGTLLTSPKGLLWITLLH
ncbi:Variant surface glycoprotein [Trypanosoma congolense IL3000]|uniref:Variant surface glycoprotein n=1 Tax=Trypanosoma congolense (strain IL3000) TaxID=1068625 RepID=F9W7Z1_TRYCI|nr:Variant surface glycoprotein [Trypanosoma congolense IL3000]